MGTTRATFAAIRTHVAQAHDAHRHLRQREQIGVLTDVRQLLFLQTLNAMLGERLLPSLDSGIQEGAWRAGELEAVGFKISPFMVQVKEILHIAK